jgi:hypothetical protein
VSIKRTVPLEPCHGSMKMSTIFSLVLTLTAAAGLVPTEQAAWPGNCAGNAVCQTADGCSCDACSCEECTCDGCDCADCPCDQCACDAGDCCCDGDADDACCCGDGCACDDESCECSGCC